MNKSEFTILETENKIVVDLKNATFLVRFAIAFVVLFKRYLEFKNPKVLIFKLKPKEKK